MSRSDEERLGDIVEAARRLAEITSAGWESFSSDWMPRAAAERMMHVIGEAMCRDIPQLIEDLAADSQQP